MPLNNTGAPIGIFLPTWLALLWLSGLTLACGPTSPIDYSGPTALWPEFSGPAKGQGSHYSPLTQINRENVGQLELAWEHRTGDAFPGSAELAPTAHQVTPLVVNDTLYYCTPYMRVFALDPETGEERWVFDPQLKARASGGPYPLTCRGLAYWAAEDPKDDEPCQRRLLYGTKDSELLAIDADSGKLCGEFGQAGRVALREGIEEGIPAWEYYPTSPPLIMATSPYWAHWSRISSAPTRPPESCAPSTFARASSAGPGIPFRQAGSASVKAKKSTRAAPPMCGPCCRATKSAVLYSFRRAMRRPIPSAANATASTTTRAPSSHSMP